MTAASSGWACVPGQEPVKRALQRALAQRRLSHAYLFTGEPGLGQERMALILAQAVLCEAGGPDPCGACEGCRRVAAGRHPDLGWLRPDGLSLRLRQVQEMLRELSLRPLHGSHRVFVLEEADRLTGEAANVLLKTLEEPPPGALLILLSALPDRLPATVLSRCQRMVFRPAPYQEVALALEEQGLAPARAALLARLARGNLGAARRLSEREEIEPMRDAVLRVLGHVHSWPLSRRLEEAEAWSRWPDEAPTVLDLMGQALADLLAMQVDPEFEAIFWPDRRSELLALRPLWTPPSCQEAIRQTWQASDWLRQNVNRRLSFDVYLANLKGPRAQIYNEATG